MGIARSTISKANALRSKVLCVLIILSLLGQTAPVLAREPISAASNTPAAQLGNRLTEPLDVSHLTPLAAPVTAAAPSHASQLPSESWLITWDASAEANATDGVTRVTRRSRVTASIVVNYYDDGSSDYYANEYTATYLVDKRSEGNCGYGGHWLYYDRVQLLDPARYSGIGPVKPNGVMPNGVMPWKPIPYTGNQWILPALNLSLGGFTIASHFESQECEDPVLKRDKRDLNSLLYLEYLPTYAFSGLVSGDDGVFRYDADTQVQLEDYSLHYPLKQKNHLRVERLSGCKVLAAPIDISNPDLKSVELNLQAQDTTPDGEATLQAKVTCQGVPVINAPVVVKLKVKERSGGHDHTGGNRPRGYIDGVEQNADTKFIGITGRDGTVSFAIRPGRDLTDKSRGIAGWYIVDAKVEWEGLTSYPERAYINAHLDGLVPLSGDELVNMIQVPTGHSEVLYGTPATVQVIQKAANVWALLQVLHNQSLSSKGKAPWPIHALTVFGISLPQGGLFDQGAWLGSRYMWRTPFKQHRTGEDVWLKSSWYNEPIEQRLWYNRAFRDLGNEYGTWFSDADTPNLKITRAPANLLERSMPALSQSLSTGPDVAASAALVNPTGRFVAGAGQLVTYTVGVENLVSGTVASQVALRAALPAGLSFISANPTQSRMQDSRTPVWDIGSLPDEGAPRTFDVTARVNPSTAVGTLLTITATATTSSQDANPGNNQFNDWGLTVQQPGSDLVIGSDLNATALTVGEPVSFTIQLGNEGNAPASNSRLDLTVPTGITITQTSPTANVIPGGVHWNAGALAPGSRQTFTVSLQIDPGLLDLAALSPDVEPVYPLSFLMTAGSDSTDIDPASNRLQVDKRVELPGPDLLMALQAQGTPGPGVFQVGQEVTYTLRYGNFGNREAGEVSGELLLWPGLTLMQAQPAPTTNQSDATSGVRTLTWNLGELSIGEEGAIALRLRVDDVPEVGSIVRADISSNNLDLNPADNAVTETRYKAYASNAGGYKIYLPFVKR